MNRSGFLESSPPPPKKSLPTLTSTHSLPRPSHHPRAATPASSVPPFRLAVELLLTPSPVRASKLTQSLTQLTSQTLSSGSTVAGLASCLHSEALFYLRRCHLCSSVLSSFTQELLPPTGTDRGCCRCLWKVCSSALIASFLFSLPLPESLHPARRLAVAVT
nr:uncharacterized protein LOC112744081 [Arachis hypogaea]